MVSRLTKTSTLLWQRHSQQTLLLLGDDDTTLRIELHADPGSFIKERLVQQFDREPRRKLEGRSIGSLRPLCLCPLCVVVGVADVLAIVQFIRSLGH